MLHALLTQLNMLYDTSLSLQVINSYLDGCYTLIISRLDLEEFLKSFRYSGFNFYSSQLIITTIFSIMCGIDQCFWRITDWRLT